MTCPPSAFVKMLLVVDTLSESLNIVVTNSNAGKIEKSNGDFVFIAINSIVIAIVILIMSSKSINIIGSGTINISTMPIIPQDINISLSFMIVLPYLLATFLFAFVRLPLSLYTYANTSATAWNKSAGTKSPISA